MRARRPSARVSQASRSPAPLAGRAGGRDEHQRTRRRQEQGRRRQHDPGEQRRLGFARRQREPDRPVGGPVRRKRLRLRFRLGTQAVGQKASNEQAAAAKSSAVQKDAKNTNVSVRIFSDGDNGNVSQSNTVDSKAKAGT